MVGKAKSIVGTGLGEIIDSHDIVVRVNGPDIKGYEADVGSRCNHYYLPAHHCAGWCWIQPNAKHIIFRSNAVAKDLNSHKPNEDTRLNEDCIKAMKREHTHRCMVLQDPRLLVSYFDPKTKEFVRQFGCHYDLGAVMKRLDEVIPAVQVWFATSDDEIAIKNQRDWKREGFQTGPLTGTWVTDYYMQAFPNAEISVAGMGSPYSPDDSSPYYEYYHPSVHVQIINETTHHDPPTNTLWLENLHRQGKIKVLELEYGK